MLFEGSGIAPGVARERGTYSVRRGADVPQTSGWLPMKPGIVFPVHTLDGETFPRLRPDNPGRLPKYMQPKGHPNRLDVHPRQHERIKQPGGMRYVTEGEKKVDAGVSRGLLMVGLSGVWNGQKDKELIPDWDLLPLKGERYCIVFDSDIESNPDIQMAADRQERLLRERGAEVFIALLPPAPDGSKQGLDDFFAAGGTVKELKLLRRPYSTRAVEKVRLSRDEKLRAIMEDLTRTFWDTEWKGMGGATAHDVYFKLIEAARRHGKIHPDGIRVTKAQGPLALEAGVSTRTLWKALNRLEEWGLIYRDNKRRKADKAGAFVLRAKVSHNGERREACEGNGTPQTGEGAPGDLHLRAPRLRWSRPKYTPRRGLVHGTSKVRQTPKPEPRDRIERLGKIRGGILDVLDKEGPMDINELAAALHRRRARDLRRRNLPMLEEAGIITVEGNTISLTDNWLKALEDQRKLGKETEADELARERYKEKSRAFHSRNRDPVSKPSAEGLDAIRASREKRRENLAGWVEKSDTAAHLSPLAVAIRDYLDAHPTDARQPAGWIGSTLWAYDLHPDKPSPAETKAAIEELGGSAYLDGLLKRAA
jgi:predicted transcriptional regulator